MKASYKEICEKLGYDPLTAPYESQEDDWLIDDNEDNVFGKLNKEEIELLTEIAIATQSIRRAAGFI